MNLGTRIGRRTAITGALAAVGAAACGAAPAQTPSPLRALLALAAPDMVRGRTEIFRFLDLAALRALGADGPVEETVLMWPALMADAQRRSDAWPGLAGFARGDIAQTLQVGSETDRFVFVAGRFAAGPLGAALARHGFATREAGGVTVWRRQDDDELDPAGIGPAWPFGGDQGLPQRLALVPGGLAFAMTDAGIALATAPSRASLLDLPEASIPLAAAEADLGDGAVLVQATVLLGAQLMDGEEALRRWGSVLGIPDGPIDEAQRREILARPPFPLLAANPLPPTGVVLFGERRSAARTTTLVALPYLEEKAARDAAAALAARIAGYFRLNDPARANVVAAAGASVSHRVHAARDGHAAIVAVTGPATPPGAPQALFERLLNDDDGFWPLWTW